MAQAPIIPEIAKAYQNDPRTALALAAMKSGTSSDPVATRGYGITDGIARALQAVAGAYANKQTQGQYNNDQADLLALRQQRGVDGLSGQGAVPPQQGAPSPGIDLSQGGAMGGGPPISAGVDPAAVAAALGAPPAPPGGSGPPPAPMAAPPPPSAPMAAPAQGGGPVGQPPFGSSGPPPAPDPGQAAAMAAALGSPAPQAAPPPATPMPPITVQAGAPPASRFGVHEAVPAAPVPLSRPATPQAVGATVDPTLTASYGIMKDANPYESAQGQDMYTAGLASQGADNEAAAKRQQALNDMGYNTDLQRFSESQDAANKAAYAERTAAQSRNFSRDQTSAEEAFTGGQNDKNRSKDLSVANIEAASKIAAARVTSGIGADGTNSAVLKQDDLDRMAAQYIAGDKSVMTTVAGGRSAVAAINKANLNRTITAKLTGAGQNGADMAANIARYVGETRAAAATGQRVGAATVSTSELPLLTKMSSTAYTALPRGQFVPFNKLQQMYDTNAFSSPAQAKAYAADSAVIGAYARALSPIGAPHDIDKRRAAQMLSTAQSPDAHQAVLDQLNAETQAIRQGAQQALSGPAPATAPATSTGWGKAVVK